MAAEQVNNLVGPKNIYHTLYTNVRCILTYGVFYTLPMSLKDLKLNFRWFFVPLDVTVKKKLISTTPPPNILESGVTVMIRITRARHTGQPLTVIFRTSACAGSSPPYDDRIVGDLHTRGRCMGDKFTFLLL